MIRNITRLASVTLLFTALTATHLTAQEKHGWKEAESAGYTYKYVTDDPAHARFYTLDNGLTVILSPSNKEPRIQTYIAVKAGSKTDPATHTGLAHYLEHMLFKGTDKFGTLDYAKEKPLLAKIEALYETYGATTDEAARKAIYHQIDSISGVASTFAIANEYDKLMGAMGAKGTNAFTSFEQTVYIEDIPSNAIDKYLAVQAERFRHPVFRIFHTELEAVYEEKNRTLDNDSRKVFENMFAALFPHNNYGKQTTIGTISHLKNPSLVEIRKYFNTYYVPNNMGIIMAGDFDPDKVIRKIDEAFSYMEKSPIPEYTFTPEQPIESPVVREVFGPEPARVMLGYRLPGASSKDAQLLELVGSMLTNGSAGLIDLNLVKNQKLLSAYAFPYLLKDYSMLLLQGSPTEGQDLDQVKKLLLGEIEKLRTGNFPESLITSIINNEKKDVIETTESYSDRAGLLMDNFTSDVDWLKTVSYVSALNQITKDDIVAFANKYLKDDNYVVIYKREGEDKNVVKVEKPDITPVSVNRDAQSDFLKKINAMPVQVIEPKWVDYQRDIQRSQAGSYPVLQVQNKDNNLFRLYYYYNTGSWSNKLLPIAAEYLEYIGTHDKTAEEISKAFYQIASSFRISVGSETTVISIDGLQENFEKAVALFDELIQHCIANPEALEAYKARLIKARGNAKQNKGQIMRGLINYAQYGPENPFNNELTDAQLKALTADDLIHVLHDLRQYPHQILYYGPKSATEIATAIQPIHPAPAQFKALPPARKFVQQDITENQILFAHYDMVQAEVYLVRNAHSYLESMVPTVQFFNEYFGGGMGSIVFQTIRESKALAYSTFAYYATPSDKDYRFSAMAYVGTQADKFHEAVTAMNELLNTLPESQKAFETARDGLYKSLATNRITQEGILFSYLNAQKMGRDDDIRKKVFQKIPDITFETLRKFHQDQLSHKPFTYCVVAGKDKLTQTEMEKFGSVKSLSLEEIFGY